MDAQRGLGDVRLNLAVTGEEGVAEAVPDVADLNLARGIHLEVVLGGESRDGLDGDGADSLEQVGGTQLDQQILDALLQSATVAENLLSKVSAEAHLIERVSEQLPDVALLSACHARCSLFHSYHPP